MHPAQKQLSSFGEIDNKMEAITTAFLARHRLNERKLSYMAN